MTRGVAQPGTVYLVGAGPGDPGLLTMRAAELLRTADSVFHDDLVHQDILDVCGNTTELLSVGKRCGNATITQANIHVLLIASAREGRSVVRLKSGDPLIFGRASEELAALAEAGVPTEIVPGVTSASAAAAAVRLPLTDRLAASRLLLVTRHHAAGKAREPLWQGPLPQGTTVAVYMPGRDFGALGRELLHAGLPGGTRCVAVSAVSTAEQHVVETRLEELGSCEIGPAPVLVLAGGALGEIGEDAELAKAMAPLRVDSCG